MIKKENSVDFIFLFFLFLCALKLTWHFELFSDINLADESAYLQSGLRLPEAGLPRFDRCPLYALWYYVHSLWISDPVRLYDTSRALLVLLTTLLVYSFLRGLSVKPLVAAAGTLAYLGSRIYISVAFDSTFALLILLLWGNFLVRIRNPFFFANLAMAATLTAAFARPEFLLSALLLGFFYLAYFLFRRQWRSCLVFSGWNIVTGLLFIKLSPFVTKRTWATFSLHFWRNWNSLLPKPEKIEYFDRQVFISKVFGESHSLPDAMGHSGGDVFRHILHNFFLLKKTIPVMFGFSFENLLPEFSVPLLTGTVMTASACILAYGIFKTSLFRRPLQDLPGKERFLFVCALILPGLASSVIIFPRDHYLILHRVLLLSACAVIVSKEFSLPRFVRVTKPQTAFLTGLFFLLATPNLVHGWQLRAEPQSVQAPFLPVRKTIETIRNLPLSGKEPVYLLSRMNRYSLYLGEGFRMRGKPGSPVSFRSFARTKPVDIIIFDDPRVLHRLLGGNPYWKRIQKNPEKFGYREIPSDGVSYKLFVRKEVHGAGSLRPE